MPARTANGSGRACLARVAYISPALPPFGGRRSGRVLVEVRFEDLQRGRRRRFGAEAAFLDRHDGDDTRVRVRGEHDVPGLVGVAGRCAVPVLPATGDREAAEDAVGGAARRSAPPRAGPSRIAAAVAGVDLDVAARLRVEFLQHPAGRVLDFHADVRGDDGAAVGERRVGDRHLQRVGLQVALAGRQLDVVAGRPGPVGFAFLVELVAPLLARQQAFGLARAGRARSARRSPACAPSAAAGRCPTSRSPSV